MSVLGRRRFFRFSAPTLDGRASTRGPIFLYAVFMNMLSIAACMRDVVSRPGNDLTHRFPLIVETLARLSPQFSRHGTTIF
jgi:hypothetical protein